MMSMNVSRTDEENKEADVSGNGTSIDMDLLIGE